MKTYARMVDGSATDVTTLDPKAIFHADIASQFVEVPSGTEQGDRLVDGKWIKHEAPAAPEPVIIYEVLTPMTLYMAFTPTERIAIKASKDPYVMEFWDMYQLSVQLQKPTDPNLISVRSAIEYLARPATAEPPGAGILASEERVQQILLGIPQ